MHEDSAGKKRVRQLSAQASKDKVLKEIFSRINQEHQGEKPKRILASAGSVQMSDKEQRRKRKLIPQSRSTGQQSDH